MTLGTHGSIENGLWWVVVFELCDGCGDQTSTVRSGVNRRNGVQIAQNVTPWFDAFDTTLLHPSSHNIK